MLSIGISCLGCTELNFIDPGVYYLFLIHYMHVVLCVDRNGD